MPVTLTVFLPKIVKMHVKVNCFNRFNQSYEMNSVNYKKVNGLTYPVRRACSLIRLLIGPCVSVRSISLRASLCSRAILLLLLLVFLLLKISNRIMPESYPVVLFRWFLWVASK